MGKVQTQNEFLSDKLKVEPLKKGQTATYRLISAGKKNPYIRDETTNVEKRSFPANFVLSKEIEIIDSGADYGSVLLQSVVGWQPIRENNNKNDRFNPIFEAINMNEQGSVTLDHSRQEQYIFMERHPLNRDNPYRDYNRAPLFYKEDIERDKRIRFEHNELIADLMAYVGLCSASELEQIRMALIESGQTAFFGLPTQPDFIRNSLYGMIPLNDHAEIIMKHAPSGRLKIQKKIMDLAKIEKIRFKEADRIWMVHRPVGESGKRKFGVSIQPGDDPVKGFIDWLMSEDAIEDLNTLNELHTEFYETVMT